MITLTTEANVTKMTETNVTSLPDDLSASDFEKLREEIVSVLRKAGGKGLTTDQIVEQLNAKTDLDSPQLTQSQTDAPPPVYSANNVTTTLQAIFKR